MRVALATIALLGALAGGAHADSRRADEAFTRGRELLAAGQLDEACVAFTESLREEFQFGTLYNLGTCEEQRGHWASAARAFRRVMAGDPNVARQGDAKTRLLAGISRRISRVILDIPDHIPGLKITVDGTDTTEWLVAGTTADIELDPGQHAIAASAPGRRAWQTTAAIVQDGTVVRVTIALDVADAPEAAARSTVTTEIRAITIPESGHPRAARAMVFGGIGGMVAGGVFFFFAGIDASRNYHCAVDKLPAQSCAASGIPANDPAYANHQIHNLRVYGALTDVIELLSIGALVGGIYLWRHSSYELVVTPAAGATFGGVSLTGSF